MQIIPVYFTFDKNYVLAAAVAIYSLLKHACRDYCYKLYVLHSDIPERSQKKLIRLVNKFGNATLEFIDVSSYNSGWDQLKNKAHFSKEIFNKLIAAELFPQYDRMICSDVDVVFTGDISESYFLYENEFFYYAGVRPILKNQSIPKYTAHFNKEEINRIRQGISGGYLLIHLKNIRENHIQEKMIRFYQKNLHRLYLPEQDCIDICCFPYLKYLPYKYVVCMFFYTLDISQIEFNSDITAFKENRPLAEQQFKESLEEAVQVHYVGSHKPWNSFFIPRWNLWMSTLFESGFFAEYLKSLPVFLLLRLKKYNLKRFIGKVRKRYTPMPLIKKIPVIRNLARRMELSHFQKEWRKKNLHNRTFAASVFPSEIVSVGKHTYGMLNIYSYYPQHEQLSIGNFVSIAPEVKFVLGGNHSTDTLTSFPLKSFYSGTHQPEDARSKGSIKVEDEVWIGIGSIILSGVTLSKGAIIAAGSVVTRDVPPYAVAGGNPAKIIKYRFPEEVIRQLMETDLTQFSDPVLKENIDLIYHPLNQAEKVRSIVEILNKGQHNHDNPS